MARVLVIADCPDFHGRLHCEMKRSGHVVLEARDALAGLQRAVEDAPDFIVIAEKLSGLPAEDVRARLAKEPTTHTVPVCLLATDESMAAVQRIPGLGAFSV